jgi:hypothetical protein
MAEKEKKEVLKETKKPETNPGGFAEYTDFVEAKRKEQNGKAK